MQFTPKSEAQLEQEETERAETMLWPNGEYPFEILEKCAFAATEDTRSEKGNDMIVLVVQLWNAEGETRIVIDYLLEKMAHKLRHAAYACGHGEKYETGDLTAYDFVGKQGTVKIKTQPAKHGYSAKNVVEDYVVPAEGQIAATAARTAKAQAAAPELDDEIPF